MGEDEKKKNCGPMEFESQIDRLPLDLLAHIFTLISSFRDLAQASGVCKKWRRGVVESMAGKENLSFNGWKMDDESTARLVHAAYNLKELDISRSCWGCRITDAGLYMISLTKCASSLTSISLWGIAGITDRGVVQLISGVIFGVQHLDANTILAKILNVRHKFSSPGREALSYVSKTTSLQHLNIGGTFITDESLFAIANSCPQLKAIVLWSCRHVTESGLFMLVNKCRKLESINVWGMRVPASCFTSLLLISPALQIRPIPPHPNLGGGLPVA